MANILKAVTDSPVLAIIGLVVVLAVLLAPFALSVAGLTGKQIIELFNATMTFIVNVIKEIRSSNNGDKNS